VLGGYGYTRDFPVERLYRDNRLNAIHEGTHGIQGLDLLGRKVSMENGEAMRALGIEIAATVRGAAKEPSLSAFGEALDAAWRRTAALTDLLVAARGAAPARALANATIYLDMFGHIVIAWIWLQQAQVAMAKLAKGDGDTAFYEGKLAACRFFFRYELPKTETQARLLGTVDDTSLLIDEAAF
jgi:hypothetical protein